MCDFLIIRSFWWGPSPLFKVFIEFVTTLPLLFISWFLGHESRVIWALQWGIKATPFTLEGEVPTTRAQILIGVMLTFSFIIQANLFMSYRIIMKVHFLCAWISNFSSTIRKDYVLNYFCDCWKSIEDIWGGLILNYSHPQCIFYVHIKTILPWLQ